MDEAAQSNGTSDDNLTVTDPQKVSHGRGRWRLVMASALAIFIVLALALGLGLGLGLTRDKNTSITSLPSTTSAASPTSSTAAAPSSTPTPIDPLRRGTLDYNLDMSWDINAPPTTRIFNLTLSEIEAAPDGGLLLYWYCAAR